MGNVDQRVKVIRYRTRGPAETEENVRLIKAVFSQLDEIRPEGVRYAAYQLGDGQDFMHVVAAEDGSELSNLPAFKEFQQDIADRIVDRPQFAEATRLGAYTDADK
jgi:hypothetical protein